MLLKKIRTKGFLGHLKGAAENDFVELDFGDKNLWLIQGRNGVGKSTLFDAITMAFFRQHRGGGSNFANLVHDKADRAEIFVEFEFHGNDYRIAVDMPKKSTVARRLQFWNGAEWTTKNDDIDEWVEKNLKMSYETFVCSVLLLQGEADKFITVKPTPRRKMFLELLQLEVYTKLTERAKLYQKCAGDQFKKIKETLDTLENPSAAEIKNQEKLVKHLGEELLNLEKERDAKKKEVDDAELALKLKKEIEQIEAQQEADAALFENAAQVEEKYRYFIDLKDNLFRIENVWREKKDIAQIENDSRANEQKIAGLEEKLKTVENELIKNLAVHQRAQNELLKIESAVNSAKAKRDEVAAEIREIERIENIEAQIARANESLPPLRQNIIKAKEKLDEIERQITEKTAEKGGIESLLRDAKAKFLLWSDKLENRRKVVDKDECPACGNELKNEETRRKLVAEYKEAEREVKELTQSEKNLNAKQSILEIEFSEIVARREKSKEEHQALLQKENSLTTKIETLLSQIMTTLTVAERQALRRYFAELENQVERFEIDVKTAKENATNLGEVVGDLEKSKAGFNADLKNARENLQTLGGRREKAEANLAEAEKLISPNWRNHKATREEAHLQNLRREKDELQSVESQHENLKQARNRKANLEGQKASFAKQFEEIPASNRRKVSEVKSELERIVEKIGIVKLQRDDADNLCRKMMEDKSHYEEKSAEMKVVKEDFEIWKKLAKALGKEGLETKVVRDAQVKISENANKTLNSLSDGNFRLELEDSGKEMKIFVRDFATGEQRQIEYFSGGEKFLTAVSLAVAIGQSVCGQNIANTLIIDEGFGALDNKNRSLMAKELERLSEILQNGRVVIVSHQDDVQENFANRFHLDKTNEGIINVHVNL